MFYDRFYQTSPCSMIKSDHLLSVSASLEFPLAPLDGHPPGLSSTGPPGAASHLGGPFLSPFSDTRLPLSCLVPWFGWILHFLQSILRQCPGTLCDRNVFILLSPLCEVWLLYRNPVWVSFFLKMSHLSPVLLRSLKPF